MCMADDADGFVTVLNESFPKARKEHVCNECRRQIQRGEQYMLEKYVFDGEVKTHKTCAHCQVVRSWLMHECSGFLYGAIEEDICEHAWEGYGVGVKMLAVGMRRNWQRKTGGLWPIPRMPKVSGHAIPAETAS